MKKLLLVFIFFFAILLCFLLRPKTYNVILEADGFQPTQLTIKKGDTVKFTTTLDKLFWPASDPHPTHSSFSDFDPKRGLKFDESWQYKFNKAGEWTYHDHLAPNMRGKIVVKETDPPLFLFEKLHSFYKFKLQKHDLGFLTKISSRCNKLQDNRGDFLDCWYSFYSGITNDFGTLESVRLIRSSLDEGMITQSDCHLFVDQLGTDAYWQFIDGNRFALSEDFAICNYGFFHGFMSEHMSHGEDLIVSQDLCDSLTSVGNMLKQCYVGIGNGLAFYFWEIFNNDVISITQTSVGKCNELSTRASDCAFGVYSGIDHLYLGLHGSNLTIDVSNPFQICVYEPSYEYKKFCYERMIPSLFSRLNFDVYAINKFIEKMPFYAQKNAANRVGIMISELENYKSDPAVDTLLSKCRLFSTNLVTECLNGVFYSLLSNTNNPKGVLRNFSCDSEILNVAERNMCVSQKEGALWLIEN